MARAKVLLRLDQLLVQKGLAQSRAKAQALVLAGKVLVNGHSALKPGHRYPQDSNIALTGTDCPYVSRGGLKLSHALSHFDICVKGLVCMDVGASTGGFTHCLLLNGAKLVYAIDVGYGQLDWGLRNDPRVVVLERTNIRYLDPSKVEILVDLVTIDTSFISLKLVIPCVLRYLGNRGQIIALIKPQFEVGRDKVGKGGIVRDPRLHKEVISDLETFFTQEIGLTFTGVVPSPILGAKGNREFLVHLTRRPL